MAKQIKRGKFLLIECTAGELMNAVAPTSASAIGVAIHSYHMKKGAILQSSINGTAWTAL